MISSDAYGYGTSDGSGYGYGYGYGSGSGVDSQPEVLRAYFKAAALGEAIYMTYSALDAIREPNVEIRRIALEALGPDQLAAELASIVVHADTDGCNNPRQLLRLTVPGTRRGYIQVVKVVCPTTKRVYHLQVPSDIKTCQEAVASTFGCKPEEYAPVRES